MNTYQHAVTPLPSAHLDSFCRRHLPTLVPRLLISMALPGIRTPQDVADFARTVKGSTMSGWWITEFPGQFIEAVHHTVWHATSPRGNSESYFDAVQHERPFHKILFAPDPDGRVSYLGKFGRREAMAGSGTAAGLYVSMKGTTDMMSSMDVMNKPGRQRMRPIVGPHATRFVWDELRKLSLPITPDGPCPCNCGQPQHNCDKNRLRSMDRMRRSRLRS